MICKDTVKKMRSQATDGDKIFAKHISNKRFVSEIYKEPLQFSNNKTKNPINKWSIDLNRHFTKGDM